MPDGLVWVFQKLLIYWDFHSQPSLGITENGPKIRKYPVSGSCVDINALLMSEVREEWASSDGYFQQDNAPRHKAQIISDWFLEHDNEFTLLKWPPELPDLNPIEHLWDVVEWEIRIMNVQPTNLQQLRDAIMSIWTKISEECFQKKTIRQLQLIQNAAARILTRTRKSEHITPVLWSLHCFQLHLGLILTYFYSFINHSMA